ncbi:Glutathione peroxidase 1 [Mizuhopecten yessoensis]|uniref:Glutathione peroxidase 1 n=1 Tax=Mizuhopecten yessoensis TaxID=6573 RepID=A0A210Q6K7_MIZYE|nr:Glutathione peroxidase 1 [Mizuhopecten yessoensis]
MNGIMHVRPGVGFKPNFRHTEIININGHLQHPLYVYLKRFCPPIHKEFFEGLYYSPLSIYDVHWNFEKFLVGRDGRIVKRYHPDIQPVEVRADIERELNKNVSPVTNE